MSGSPVIEAGDPSIMGGVDQRGFDRVFDGINLMAGGIVDMGSVEYGSGDSAPTVDFDGDGNANCNDIDALHAVIVAGSNDPAFDLTGDGNVDINDQSQWLADAAVFNGFATPYQQADFNLDRVVDVSDFGIWNSAKFTTNSAFCSGDANADGVVDVSDFGIWNAAKFTSADSAARGDASATLTREDVRSMRAQLNDADESADPIDDFQMAGDNDRVAARVVQQSIAIADQPLESQTVATSNLVDFEANIVNVPAVDFDILVVHDQEDAADDRLRVATVNEIFAEEVEWL
jgi:hypothetical protein